eukprot:c7907_g1_i3.p1 GENE.c7907_g1_i3~~c7907_g1_i3.p1  ORF type:complete len:647 (-),score=157.64 c7907_g1_i3:46-1986(-)
MYTEFLKPIALLGVFFWIIFRLVVPSAIVYFRILALYGFLVATVWGPMVLRYWHQKTGELNFKWKLANWQDELDPNPDFDWGDKNENSRKVANRIDELQARQTFFRYCVVGQEVVDRTGFEEMCHRLPGLEHLDTPEKRDAQFASIDSNSSGLIDIEEFLKWARENKEINYVLGIRPQNPPWRKWWHSPLAYFELFLLTLFLAASILMFLYWYVSAMLIPVCGENDSRSWPNCFGTAGAGLGTGRWLYVFLQGLTLGIFLDTLLEAFVRWVVSKHSDVQNFTTLKAKEDYYTGHLFGYLYLGWFLWYALLGFVYVPFGSWIQAAQKLILGDNWVNEWVPGAISMDTAMVTPLIVTQALNLLLDTLIPYIERKFSDAELETTGPDTLGKPIAEADPDADSKHKVETDSPNSSLVGDATRQVVSSLQLDSTLAPTVYLTSTIPTWGWDKAASKMARRWKSATHIVDEGNRGDWAFFSQMLDPAIQFSYCVNFSAIWPMTALCAYINNYFEIKSDLLTLFIGSRRPAPRKVNGIGAWVSCLHFSVIAGVFFAVGMITVASSGLEAFVAPESCGLTDHDFTMTPSIGCMGGSSHYRLASILVLEHLGLFMTFVVYRTVSKASVQVEETKLKTSMKMKRQFERHWAETFRP